MTIIVVIIVVAFSCRVDNSLRMQEATTAAVETVYEDAQKARTLPLRDMSPPTVSPVVDDRRAPFIAVGNVYAVGLSWDDRREPYSPWTGVKTAVGIAAVLTLFLVYVTVRTRCTPACRRDVVLRLRRAARSATPSWMFARRTENSSGEEVDPERPPVVFESSTRCLRRAELELQVEVVNDEQKKSPGSVQEANSSGASPARGSVNDLVGPVVGL